MKRTLLLVCLLLMLSACTPYGKGKITWLGANGSTKDCRLQIKEKTDFAYYEYIPEGGEIDWNSVGGLGQQDATNKALYHYQAPEQPGQVSIQATIKTTDQNKTFVFLNCTVGDQVEVPATITLAPAAEKQATPLLPAASPSFASETTLTKTMIYAPNPTDDPHGADDPPNATAVVPTSSVSTALKPTAVQVVSVPPSDTPEPPPTDTPPPPPPTNTPCRDNRDGCKK